MKNILFSFGIAVLFAACGGEETSSATTTNSSTAQILPGSPEEFASQITQLVIDSNYDAIAAMIIQQDEMVELIQSSSVSTMGKEVAVKNVPTEIGKMKIDFANGLKQIRDGARTSGVEWSNCKFKEAKYEIAAPNGYDMMQLKCIIDCNGMTQTFTVTDVVKTDNGWKLGGTMMFGDVQTK